METGRSRCQAWESSKGNRAPWRVFSRRACWALDSWILAGKSAVGNPLGGAPVMFTPHLRMCDNGWGKYQGSLNWSPYIIIILLHLGRLRARESSYLPAVKKLPNGANRAARYTAAVKWLLKSASHRHFPSHCPDGSSADLNGELWFFPFLITVQASSRARFRWGPKWFSFSLNFFSPASPSGPSFWFQRSPRSRLLTFCFCFSLERQRVYKESPSIALPCLALDLTASWLRAPISSSQRGWLLPLCRSLGPQKRKRFEFPGNKQSGLSWGGPTTFPSNGWKHLLPDKFQGADTQG